VAIGICFAIATGTSFLKWTAPKPRRVLLVDGEMPAAALQERLASMVASNPTVPLSQTLGRGTVGHPEDNGTLLGTLAGQHYGSVLTALCSKCPELVET